MAPRRCERCGARGSLVYEQGFGHLCSYCQYQHAKTFRIPRPSRDVLVALRDAFSHYPEHIDKSPLYLATMLYGAGFLDRRPSAAEVESAIESLMGDRDQVLS
jgi:hypothetical protein